MSVFVVHLAWSDDIPSLKVAFWNVENLFDLIDDPKINDDEFAVGGKKYVTKGIYELKLKNSAEVLADLNADILGICEVENRFMMEELNDSYAERDYKIVHYDSPDSREIDNALLYDPNVFNVISSTPIQNTLPDGNLTRDILYVKGEYAGHTLHIFVNHWPSNYGGKKKAIPKRRSTARLLANEVAKLLSEDPDADILLMGDFNEDPTDDNVRILKSVNMTSMMASMMGQRKVGTYVYKGVDYFMDQIIISDGLNDDKGLIAGKAQILDKPFYRQQEGNYAHYPFRFWAGNKLLGGYSDHLAVYVEILKVSE